MHLLEVLAQSVLQTRLLLALGLHRSLRARAVRDLSLIHI